MMIHIYFLLIILSVVLIILIYTCKSKLISGSIQLIPRQIFQTHKDIATVKKLGLDKFAKDLIDKNPEYNYYFYDDNDCEEYIKNNFDQSIYDVYKRLKHPVARSDFWRALIIYKEGGIYIDMDNKLSKPLREIIQPDDQFLKGITWVHRNQPNPQSFIISTARHPVMEKMVNHIIQSIINNKPIMEVCNQKSVWRLLEGYTGTPAMWKALVDVIGTCELKPGKYEDGVRLVQGKGLGSVLIIDPDYKRNLKSNKISHWMEHGDRYSDIFYY